MKRIISMTVVIIMLFTLLNTNNTSIVIAAGSPKYEGIQLNTFLKAENSSYNVLKAYNYDKQIMVKIDDIKMLTQSDSVKKVGTSEYIIIKGKKNIVISTSTKQIRIYFQYPHSTDVIKYNLPIQPSIIDGQLYLPIEDVLTWLDADYKIYDYGIEVIPHKITLMDYISSSQFIDEFNKTIFNFGTEVGMNYDKFKEIANVSDYINSIYDATSVDVFRWTKGTNRLLGAITNVNTALRENYSAVIKLMMTNSDEENQYLNDIVGENFVEKINKLNWYRGCAGYGFDNIKLWSYEKDFNTYKNLYEHLDEVESELKNLGYGTNEIKDVFGSQVIEKNLKNGRIVSNSLDSNEYVQKVNEHFDLKLFGKIMDIANSTGIGVTAGVNVFDSLQEHFDRDSKKIILVDNVFVSTKNSAKFPQELKDAAINEVNNYKNEFSKNSSAFIAGAYGATKDGQIYDWISLFSKGALTKSAMSELFILNAWSTYLYNSNFANYKNNQAAATGILHTLASHLIEVQALDELERRVSDWNNDENNLKKLDALRSPLIATLLSSQVSYQSMREYYSNSSDKVSKSKLEELLSFSNKKINESIKLANYIEGLPLMVNSVDKIERFDIKKYKDFIANVVSTPQQTNVLDSELKKYIPSNVKEYQFAYLNLKGDANKEVLISWNNGNYSETVDKYGSCSKVIMLEKVNNKWAKFSEYPNGKKYNSDIDDMTYNNNNYLGSIKINGYDSPIFLLYGFGYSGHYQSILGMSYNNNTNDFNHYGNMLLQMVRTSDGNKSSQTVLAENKQIIVDSTKNTISVNNGTQAEYFTWDGSKLIEKAALVTNKESEDEADLVLTKTDGMGNEYYNDSIEKQKYKVKVGDTIFFKQTEVGSAYDLLYTFTDENNIFQFVDKGYLKVLKKGTFTIWLKTYDRHFIFEVE